MLLASSTEGFPHFWPPPSLTDWIVFSLSLVSLTSIPGIINGSFVFLPFPLPLRKIILSQTTTKTYFDINFQGQNAFVYSIFIRTFQQILPKRSSECRGSEPVLFLDSNNVSIIYEITCYVFQTRSYRVGTMKYFERYGSLYYVLMCFSDGDWNMNGWCGRRRTRGEGCSRGISGEARWNKKGEELD